MSSNNKKGALGRGLGALLQSPETDITTKTIRPAETASVGSIADLPIEQIVANPFQPRTHFEEEALKELSESIQEMGLIQPVTVRKMGYDQYQLISGERRFRASQMAGLTLIPAYIRIANDQAMLEMALVENIQREELDSIEIALAYQRLIEEVKLTQEEVSEKVAKKRSTITNYLRLLRLPPEIQLGIRTRKLSMGHARALINIEDPQQQLNLYNQIVSNELSVRQVEEAARAVKSPEKKSIERSTFKVSAELKSAINQINKKINTPLEVKVGKDGTGLLNIKFQSNEELEDLLKKLTH
jgi:ParB family transcriptional regulator, chromosome partitioning protein